MSVRLLVTKSLKDKKSQNNAWDYNLTATQIQPLKLSMHHSTLSVPGSNIFLKKFKSEENLQQKEKQLLNK